MSNKYCQALVELRNKPAHELKEVGDQWRTPDNIFWGINTLFGPFVLDLFTDGDNAKCAAYYTAEDNALAHDWSERLAELKGAAFGTGAAGQPTVSATNVHNTGFNITVSPGSGYGASSDAYYIAMGY